MVRIHLRVAQMVLWVLTLRGEESREGNRGNMKNENGKHANSDTRGGQQKIGPIILQRILKVYPKI